MSNDYLIHEDKQCIVDMINMCKTVFIYTCLNYYAEISKDEATKLIQYIALDEIENVETHFDDCNNLYISYDVDSVCFMKV